METTCQYKNVNVHYSKNNGFFYLVSNGESVCCSQAFARPKGQAGAACTASTTALAAQQQLTTTACTCAATV